MQRSLHQFGIPRRIDDCLPSPVSIDAVKRPLGFEDVTDDAVVLQLKELIETATETVEHDTQRALMSGRWLLCLDRFSMEICLRRPPVTEVESVKYIDESGVLQTLDPENYQADLSSVPARIRPAYGVIWPCTQCVMNAVQITFRAGAESKSAVPAIAREAVKVAAVSMYRGCDPGAAYEALIGRLQWEGGL